MGLGLRALAGALEGAGKGMVASPPTTPTGLLLEPDAVFDPGTGDLIPRAK